MHNDTNHTAEGLNQIIRTIKDLGYEIVPVSEMIYQDNYEINHEGRQILKATGADWYFENAKNKKNKTYGTKINLKRGEWFLCQF